MSSTNHVSVLCLYLRRSLTCIGLIVTVVFAGCGDSSGRVAVSGSVSVNGQPLSRGSILFEPNMGTSGAKSAGKIADGRFSIPRESGPWVGEYTIRIYADENPSFAMDDPLAYAGAAPSAISANTIPAMFNERSILVRKTTDDGPNEFQFELDTTSQKRSP